MIVSHFKTLARNGLYGIARAKSNSVIVRLESVIVSHFKTLARNGLYGIARAKSNSVIVRLESVIVRLESVIVRLKSVIVRLKSVIVVDISHCFCIIKTPSKLTKLNNFINYPLFSFIK